MSLIEILRKCFISSVRSIQTGEKWKIVIVDNESSAIINNVMSLNDFLEENVTSVEFIEQKREPNAALHAIYFVTSKSDIIKCVLHDVSRKEQMYNAAHLFFTSGLNSKSVKKLTESPHITPIKTLKELYVDFYPLESKVISFSNSFSFLTLYNPFCTDLVQSEINNIAKKLASVCITLGEYPTIRYYLQSSLNSSSPNLCSKIANSLQEQLDNYKKSNYEFPPESSRPKSVLFIIDRTFDVCAPIVHEFTYQAMANDLLPIKSGKYYRHKADDFEETEAKDVVLEESDPIWAEMRHWHIRDVIDKLMEDFNKFYSENSNFIDKKKATTINDMKNMLYSLSHFKEKRDKYSLHISIAHECMKVFEDHKLSIVGVIEQDCATGLTSTGKVPKTVLEEMVPLLDDSSFSKINKIRLIILYIIYNNGLFEGDLTKLSKHSNLSPKDITVLRNLDCLGIRVIKHLGETRSYRKPILKTKNIDENSYELSRFIPLCKTLIEEYINGSLSYTLFPSTRDVPTKPLNTNSAPTSLRTGKPTWAKKNNHVSETAQRIFLFIAGGATYSESRVCYELSKTHDKNVILITSNMLTTKKWLQNLSMLKLPRESLGLPVDQPSLKVPLLHSHSRYEKHPRGAPRNRTNHSNHIYNENSDNVISKGLSEYNIGESLKNSPQKEKRDKKKIFGVF
ncbi:hypothetical protein PORY_001057 [Pneumocystis oryctolagi]|uniref:Uncharacterized protein n=1 Tax=Pneumocystis oryctolagi TaxID=42067 RepID=A0ACB7CD64_9ASCO|nr:hypothetical protein PORY_001057 [Pneumocystis oryctolagi]